MYSSSGDVHLHVLLFILAINLIHSIYNTRTIYLTCNIHHMQFPSQIIVFTWRILFISQLNAVHSSVHSIHMHTIFIRMSLSTPAIHVHLLLSHMYHTRDACYSFKTLFTTCDFYFRFYLPDIRYSSVKVFILKDIHSHVIFTCVGFSSTLVVHLSCVICIKHTVHMACGIHPLWFPSQMLIAWPMLFLFTWHALFSTYDFHQKC